MHGLIPLGPALPGALTTAEIDATMAYASNEKAASTRACYASDWRDFTAWCAGKGARRCLPTTSSRRHGRASRASCVARLKVVRKIYT
jgi:hypothetical protein